MANKHVLFRSEAREKVLQGAKLISDAVRVTLGPKSKCMLIEKKWGKLIVCNGGVTRRSLPRVSDRSTYNPKPLSQQGFAPSEPVNYGINGMHDVVQRVSPTAQRA